MPFPRAAALVLFAVAGALAAGCAQMTVKTTVESTWKDPRYAGGPVRKVFVLSLMKIDPGGRDAVEDAIVARLAATGVPAVASHTVLSDDPQRPGPDLPDAIKASGADGVLLVQVKSVGSYELGYVPGETVTSLSPDVMASYNALKREGANQTGDYKIARIVSELYVGALTRQVWTLYTRSYDAADLARNIPDYTLKLVTAMTKDGVVAVAPKPAS